jgi:hypothetical protein
MPYKLRYICRKRPLRRLHLYSIAIPDIRHCKGPAYIFIRSLYIYSPSTISPRLFSNDRTSKLYAIPFLSLSLLDAVMSLKWGGWWGGGGMCLQYSWAIKCGDKSLWCILSGAQRNNSVVVPHFLSIASSFYFFLFRLLLGGVGDSLMWWVRRHRFRQWVPPAHRMRYRPDPRRTAELKTFGQKLTQVHIRSKNVNFDRSTSSRGELPRWCLFWNLNSAKFARWAFSLDMSRVQVKYD